MSDADLTDLCRQIAAEHADRVAGGAAPAANGADPLALIGRLDDYAQALRDLSDDFKAKRGVAAMTVATAPTSETVGSYLDDAECNTRSGCAGSRRRRGRSSTYPIRAMSFWSID